MCDMFMRQYIGVFDMLVVGFGVEDGVDSDFVGVGIF